ncbi:unnamed protein product [Lathyrus sativus]|nr:unnamed protein product [Lathyrus sativus]
MEEDDRPIGGLNLKENSGWEGPWSYDFIKKKETEDGVNSNVKESTNSLSKSEKGKCICKSQNRKCISSVIDLKRVARLSTKDRYELIRSLKGGKDGIFSRSSLGSFSKENKKEVIGDVCEVGKAIELKIKGYCSNMFGVLLRGGCIGSKKEGRGMRGRGKGREHLGLKLVFRFRRSVKEVREWVDLKMLVYFNARGL